MANAAADGSAGGRVAYKITATTTIDCGAGQVLERVICVASSSGTLAISDSKTTWTSTALSLAANDVLELNIPVTGTLTITKGGTSIEAIVILKSG